MSRTVCGARNHKGVVLACVGSLCVRRGTTGVWFSCVWAVCVRGGYLRNVVLVKHTLAEEDLFQGGSRLTGRRYPLNHREVGHDLLLGASLEDTHRGGLSI